MEESLPIEARANNGRIAVIFGGSRPTQVPAAMIGLCAGLELLSATYSDFDFANSAM